MVRSFSSAAMAGTPLMHFQGALTDPDGGAALFEAGTALIRTIRQVLRGGHRQQVARPPTMLRQGPQEVVHVNQRRHAEKRLHRSGAADIAVPAKPGGAGH